MPLNTPSKKTNQMGSGFTNLQRILQANKANRLGTTVAGGIQKAGQTAQGSIQQAGQQFQTQAQAEKARLDAEKARASRVLGDVTKASEEDINAFEGIRGGQTKAQTSIKDASEIAEKGREAQSLGQATGTEGGRFGLLQRYIGGGERYTGGQQRLDSLLLGQTGQGDLRKARAATSGLTDQALKTAYAAEQQGLELQNRAKGLSESTINTLQDQAVAYDKAMEAARVKAETDRAARQAADIEQLKSGEIVNEQLYKDLGIKEGTRIYGTDLTKFYNTAGKDLATKENVQTQADFDRIKALQALSGQSLQGEASAVLSNYRDPSQVDQYSKIKDYNINQENVKNAINQSRLAYGQGNVGAMAHIQESLRQIYGTNISDEEHERQIKEFGTSARENNFQRQYWSGGGYGDTALYWDRPNPGGDFWRNLLSTYAYDPRYMGNTAAYKTPHKFDRTFGALKKPEEQIPAVVPSAN
jgi:hypothetical protein